MIYKVAIVGVTGVVGRKVLKVLEERNLTEHDFVFYASKRSAGRKIVFDGKRVKIKELNRNIFDEEFDYALFCTKEDISQNYV